MLKFCFIFFLFFPVISSGQSLNTEKKLLEEEKKIILQKWGMVETAFQYRLDLLPQFGELLKDAFPESNRLITDALHVREKAELQHINDFKSLNNNDLDLSISMQDSLSQYVKNLMEACHEYAEVKADPAFIRLSADLSEIDNRIYIATTEYDKAVEKYNNAVDRYNEFIEAYNNYPAQDGEIPMKELMELHFLKLHYGKHFSPQSEL